MPNDQFQINKNYFCEGIRFHSVPQNLVSMKTEHKYHQTLVDVCVKTIDSEVFCDFADAGVTPVLCHPYVDLENDWPLLAKLYIAAALYAQKAGHQAVVLSADNDGLLHRLLSPRDRPGQPFDERVAIVAGIVKQIKTLVPICGVALTVEELCPGGLDATEGIAIAKELECSGAAFVVASGGTCDFPALKWRRTTQIKNQDDFFADDGDVWLASAAWLAGHVHIPIWAQGGASDHERAQIMAKKSGLNGLIRVALAS